MYTRLLSIAPVVALLLASPSLAAAQHGQFSHAPAADAADAATSAADAASAADALPDVDLGMTGELRLGKSYAFGGGADLQHGFGLDLRYALYPDANQDGYLGLFAAGEYQTGDAWRVAGGFSGGWGVLGLELGVSHRTATARYAGTTGLHIGQSLNFGPLSIGGRVTIPLVDHMEQNTVVPQSVQGFEAALVLRLSFGFTAHGQPRQQDGHGCHGSPHGGDGQLRNPHDDHHGGHGGSSHN